MKTLHELKKEQSELCSKLKKEAIKIADQFKNDINISAIFLTGSVARGDARIGPYGLYVDLLFIVRNSSLNLEKLFGPDIEPDIPNFCAIIDDIGYQIQVRISDEFLNKSKSENEAYALTESILLYSNDSDIEDYVINLKSTQLPRKDLALQNFHRFAYLTDSYRLEKWLYREAFLQITENYHISLMCFSNFLYASNGSFIPRDDWRIYLLFELPEIPKNLEEIISVLQTRIKNNSDLESIKDVIDECNKWMKERIQVLGW